MILYFSATGNSKYVAERIAKATNDECIFILDIMKDEKCFLSIKENENVGIVSPIYAWGCPSVIIDFLNKVSFSGKKIFDLSNKETVAVINKNAEPQIDEIIQKIQQKSSGNFMRNKLPKFVAPSYKPYYENMRKTKHFTVDDSCIGCRLCEKMG